MIPVSYSEHNGDGNFATPDMVTGGGIKLMMTFIFYIRLPAHRCKTPLDEVEEKARGTPCPEIGNVNNALALQYPPS